MRYRALHERYHEAVRDTLIRRACVRRTITYGELAQRVGLPRQRHVLIRQLPRLLEDINNYEAAEGWPLLGVLVVRKSDGRPGAGFFRLARATGRLSKRAGVAGEQRFFREELQRVYAAWAE